MKEGLVLEKFAAQSASKELVKWVETSKGGAITAEGLYSSAKAFAMAAAIKSGLHFILLNNRDLFPGIIKPQCKR